jgi:hypothetical protein
MHALQTKVDEPLERGRRKQKVFRNRKHRAPLDEKERIPLVEELLIVFLCRVITAPLKNCAPRERIGSFGVLGSSASDLDIKREDTTMRTILLAAALVGAWAVPTFAQTTLTPSTDGDTPAVATRYEEPDCAGGRSQQRQSWLLRHHGTETR